MPVPREDYQLWSEKSKFLIRKIWIWMVLTQLNFLVTHRPISELNLLNFRLGPFSVPISPLPYGAQEIGRNRKNSPKTGKVLPKIWKKEHATGSRNRKRYSGKRKIAISTGNQHLLNQKMMLVTGKLLRHWTKLIQENNDSETQNMYELWS